MAAKILCLVFGTKKCYAADVIRPPNPVAGSMSSIKRDVKKKPLPRPEAEKTCVSRPSPRSVSVPLDLLERFCSGLFTDPVAFIFRW